jgi:hypothetical protein
MRYDLVLAGDQAMVTVDHAAWPSRQFRNDQLCILPRTDHLAPISRVRRAVQILGDFLAEDSNAPLPMQSAHD